MVTSLLIRPGGPLPGRELVCGTVPRHGGGGSGGWCARRCGGGRRRLLALAWAANQFVIGAARVALLHDVSPLVVGVVVAGFGTSAPELLVSAFAVTDGQTAVAVGNVVGSNLANLTLLLGLGAVIVPLRVESRTVRREAPLVVAATVAFAVAVQGGIQRWEGALLVVVMAASLASISRQRPAGSALGDVLGEETVVLAHAEHHRLPVEIEGAVLIALYAVAVPTRA